MHSFDFDKFDESLHARANHSGESTAARIVAQHGDLRGRHHSQQVRRHTGDPSAASQGGLRLPDRHQGGRYPPEGGRIGLYCAR
mmetsp:Transcript_44887/g.143803  ORF Transcript_44887/g.143803 Transcript_44887/m.143803 type:complete len:84 (-) Transcript_44887:33-284(-)